MKKLLYFVLDSYVCHMNIENNINRRKKLQIIILNIHWGVSVKVSFTLFCVNMSLPLTCSKLNVVPFSIVHLP